MTPKTLGQMAADDGDHAKDSLNGSRDRAFLAGARAALALPEVLAMREALAGIATRRHYVGISHAEASDIEKARSALSAFDKLIGEVGE